MNEISSNATISKLFTRGRSHSGCSLVLMLQNIFPKGSQSRTNSINAHYQVLFRNSRDNLQISVLARQLCPLNSKSFLEIYKKGITLRSERLRKARPEELKAILELYLNMKRGNLTMPKRNPHRNIITSLANRNISLSNKKKWMLEYNKILYNIIRPALKE